MDEKTGLASVSFATYCLMRRAEERKIARYKWGFWFAMFLLVASNLCWFLLR